MKWIQQKKLINVIKNLQLQQFLQFNRIFKTFMILAEFKNTSSNGSQQKKQKYPASNRSFKQKRQNFDQRQVIVPQKNMQTFLNELDIINLKEVYLQNKPKAKKQNKNQLIQQSIKRLTFQKPKENNKQTHQIQQQSKQKNQIHFLQAFKKDQKFQKKAEIKVLKMEIQHQLKQIQAIASNILKRDQSKEFNKIFLKFIIKISHQQKKFDTLNFFQEFQNFCKFYKTLQKPQEMYMDSIKVQQKIFQKLALKNILVFDFIKYSLLKDKYFQTFKDLFQFLQKHANQDMISTYAINLFNVSQIKRFHYTVPYDNQSLCRQKKLYSGPIQSLFQKQLIIVQKFKATPIPKSTYEKPAEKPKSHKEKIQVVPFNFTSNQKLGSNSDNKDYYNWNRNFKANPIPKTTYVKYDELNNKQKQLARIERQKSLLQKAHYPQSMIYLDNYDQVKLQKTQQLQSKYRKQFKIQGAVKPIPNFELLHKKNIHQLQTRKQLNQTKTQPKPFNFSQLPKRQTKILHHNLQIHPQSRNVNHIKHKNQPVIKAKSTLKFQSYIQHRKKQKQAKQKQQLRKKKQIQQYQKKKNPYKDILKDRIKDQIENMPKAKVYDNKPQTSGSNVKIDLQTIYHYKPLLMDGTNKNQSKSTTYFSDKFQPII